MTTMPYGYPRSQTSIAVPRGRDYRTTTSAGAPYLATHVETTYAHRDDSSTLHAGTCRSQHQLRGAQRRLA